MENSEESLKKVIEGICRIDNFLLSYLGPTGSSVNLNTITPASSNVNPLLVHGMQSVKRTLSHIKNKHKDGALRTSAFFRVLMEQLSLEKNPREREELIKVLLQIKKRYFEALQNKKIENPLLHKSVIHYLPFNELDSLIYDIEELTQFEAVYYLSKEKENSLEAYNGINVPLTMPKKWGLEFSHSLSPIYQPQILILSFELNSMLPLAYLLKTVQSEKRPLIIIAPFFEEEAWSSYLYNSARSLITVIPVPIALKDKKFKQTIKKIAKHSGAKIFNSSEELSNATPKDLGTHISSVFIDRESAYIRTDDPKDQQILQINLEEKYFDEELSHEEILKTLSHVHSCKREGVCAGGGIGMLFASQDLSVDHNSTIEKRALSIFRSAVASIHSRIIHNANCNPLPYQKMLLKSGYPYGFNALSKTIEDFSLLYLYDSIELINDIVDISLKEAQSIYSRDSILVS